MVWWYMVWYIVGIWYGTSLYMVRYIVGIWYGTLLVYGMVVYDMVHRWYMVWYIIGIWYGTSLVYGKVHCWFLS